jgi:septum formation protein
MLGVQHTVEPAEIDERPQPGEEPIRYAQRLAREKAMAATAHARGAWVLGADTVVVLDEEMLGKPRTVAEAEDMLRKLAGRQHKVVTAVALAKDDVVHERFDVTAVWFRPATAEQIKAYVATGEPLDKAGAYGVQGKGAALVERIEGDFFSVMGLSVRLTLDLLEAAGVPYSFTR